MHEVLGVVIVYLFRHADMEYYCQVCSHLIRGALCFFVLFVLML